jgi:hypothetical protein
MMSGCDLARYPTTKNVAWIPARSNAASTVSVRPGIGPSSYVNATQPAEQSVAAASPDRVTDTTAKDTTTSMAKTAVIDLRMSGILPDGPAPSHDS